MLLFLYSLVFLEVLTYSCVEGTNVGNFHKSDTETANYKPIENDDHLYFRSHNHLLLKIIKGDNPGISNHVVYHHTGCNHHNIHTRHRRSASTRVRKYRRRFRVFTRRKVFWIRHRHNHTPRRHHRFRRRHYKYKVRNRFRRPDQRRYRFRSARVRIGITRSRNIRVRKKVIRKYDDFKDSDRRIGIRLRIRRRRYG